MKPLFFEKPLWNENFDELFKERESTDNHPSNALSAGNEFLGKKPSDVIHVSLEEVRYPCGCCRPVHVGKQGWNRCTQHKRNHAAVDIEFIGGRKEQK